MLQHRIGHTTVGASFFGLLAFCVVQSAMGQGPPAPIEDLRSSINAAIASVESIDPIDCAAVFRETKIFNDEPHESKNVRFRLYRSMKEKTLIWASEWRDERYARHGFPNKVNLSGMVLRDNQLMRTSGGRVIPEKAPFEVLYKNVVLPRPGYWGILPFPSLTHNREFLENILAEGLNETSNTSVTVRGPEIAYRMFLNRSRPPQDTWIWRFRLPDMHPVSVQLLRHAETRSVYVFDQRLVWKEIDGISRPIAMYGHGQAARRLKNDRIEEGRKEYDLEIKWLNETGQSSLTSFPSQLAIKEFIDEGMGSSGQLNQ